MNRVWTEEELEILRRDREAKVPVPVTAAKLGRPVPATYARARLIGTLVQPHQSWDEAGVARLRELVSADPPMTDKRIAAELGRTVTQIRWKMQDLGLIGVRDLSKLAKITAAETSRPKTVKPHPDKPLPSRSAPRVQPSPRPAESHAAPAIPTAAPAIAPQATLDDALKALEAIFAEQLKTIIAESEAGMIRAARAAIAEKARIDQRLVIRIKRAAEAAARREAEAKAAAVQAGRQEAEAKKAEAEAKRKAAEAARRAREELAREELARDEKAGEDIVRIVAKAIERPIEKPKAAEPRIATEKPRLVEKKPVLAAVRGVSQAAPARPAPAPAAPAAPKIVVTNAPAPARPIEPEAASGQTSGRGGWKSVRRDPARILAQAKAKAKPANRADAIDLAQAAQSAIERFIAERGVTRTETSGLQSVVSRLQARGYIVVGDETGWTIDQRHRLDSESELLAFAEARGITLSAAA